MSLLTAERSGWKPWLLAVASMAVAAFARMVWWPELFAHATFLPFFGAALLTAWYGGRGPGLFSLVVGAGIMAWGIFPPLQNFAVSNPESQIGLALYFIFGGAICVACQSLHDAKTRERASQAESHERELQRVKLEAEAEQFAAESRRKDHFLAVLAHELRNPLAPIRYAVEIARRDDERTHDSLSTIDRQVRHLSRLVEDLVDMNRIARGTLELRSRPVTAASVVASSLEATRPQFEQRRHVLEVGDIDPALTIDGDPVRLSQVVTNLLHNAAKFTPSGEGRITLEAFGMDDDVVFRVTDNGVGIDDTDPDRLFEMFEQGPTPAHQAPSGLGIGLFLAGQIVALHGGAIHLQAAPSGKGARATVRFPRVPAVAHVEAEPIPHAPASRMNVLVADDNLDTCMTLSLLLQASGHVAHVAHDGEEACRVAEAQRPDVALVDLGMPKRDGLEVCRWIRAQPWGGGIRLVAITGWGQPADIERTRSAGFDTHLVKPVDPNLVLAALATDRV